MTETDTASASTCIDTYRLAVCVCVYVLTQAQTVWVHVLTHAHPVWMYVVTQTDTAIVGIDTDKQKQCAYTY